MEEENRPAPHEGPPRCGAKTRAGTPCRRWPTEGKDRCRMHGGATPVKHGLRSKYGPPAAVLARIEEAERNPKILDLRHIGAHLYVITEDLLAALEPAEGSTEPRRLDSDQAAALVPVLRELRKATTDYRRLALDERFVDLAEARQILATALEAILRHVPDEKRGEAIRDFEALTGSADGTHPGAQTRAH